jgi:hypothetical protein
MVDEKERIYDAVNDLSQNSDKKEPGKQISD